MFVRPSQMANVSTLIDVKNRSSFVISTGSNNHMQRSARTTPRMNPSAARAPADVER
jgi:hypothetical protein